VFSLRNSPLSTSSVQYANGSKSLFRLNSNWLYEKLGSLTKTTTATARTASVKSELIFCLQISRYPKVIYFVCTVNYLEAEDGTQC